MTRRIVTAREQRELLSPWMIEAVEDDDRKRKPVVGEDDSKTTTETSEKDWSGDDNKPHAPGAVISQNPYAPDPYSSGSGAYYPAQFSSGGGGSGGGSSQSYGPHSTTSPSGGPPSASLTQALQKAGVDPAMFPLIQGFSAAEGNNPSGAPTLGFTDSQAGTTLDQHAQALAQQIQDRQSVAGEFPASGSPSDQASWMADVVGQNGVQSDWQGNAQPARSDYVNSIVQNMPAPSTPVTSGPTASSPTVSPQKSGRRILTAREQREMLSPWIIEADTSDDEEKKKNAPTQTNWGGDGTKPPMYHIPGAEPIHNKYNTGSGEYYPAQFSSGGTGTNGDGGGSGSGGGHGGKNKGGNGGWSGGSLPPIDPSSYGDLNEAAKAFGEKTNGMPYAYGHYGENGNSYDCSGLMANYYSLYTGKPMGERPDSFNTASDFEAFGFKPGYLPGAFNIGTNGGEGTGGHMAGTLPDGTNVESSSSGGVQYGGNAIGAQDFPMVYHLPPPPAAAPSTPAPTTTPVSSTPPPAAGGAAGTQVTSRRNQGMRILSAREQVEMLSPWLIEAGPRKAPLDEDAMVKNILDHFKLVTPDQIDQGRDWYKNAREWADNIAAKTNRDPERVYATIAALSPNTDWDSNLLQAAHFLMNYDPSMGSKPEDFLPTIGDNVYRAAQVHEAQNPEEMAALFGPNSGNPKIHNFYNNIMGNEDYVTIDRWMTRVLLGQNGSLVDADEGAKALSGIGHYDSMANAVRRATEQVNKAGGVVTGIDKNGKEIRSAITPAQMQAMLWLRARGDQKEKGKPSQGLSTPIPDYMHEERYDPTKGEPTYTKPKVKDRVRDDLKDYRREMEDLFPPVYGSEPLSVAEQQKLDKDWMKQELPRRLDEIGYEKWNPKAENRRHEPTYKGSPGYMHPSKVPFVARILREAQLAIEEAERCGRPFDFAQATGRRTAMEWTHTYVPQDWEELDGGGYSHPAGFEIHPSDEGGFQLWAPTVRGNRLVPIKQPTNDVQALMDWAEYTQGGPKPAGLRNHFFANTALLDDPVWVQSVADAIKGGGFTFHDRPGDGPTSGYMVSTHPDREEIIPLDEMSPEDVAKFKENNVDLFQGHPENYLGGWANQDNQKFYLDVPQHDPRLWGAVDTALDNDELAIYDLGHNWDLPTEDDGQYNPLLDSHFAHRRKR